MLNNKKLKIAFVFTDPPIKLKKDSVAAFILRIIKYLFTIYNIDQNKLLPSTRLRVFDIMHQLNKSNNISSEIYKPWKKYSIIIFQKNFGPRSYKLAQKNKKQSKIILDINVNYYNKKTSRFNTHTQFVRIIEFTHLCDGLIASSKYIENEIRKLFPNKKIVTIEENIPEYFYKYKSTPPNKKNIKFVYNGFACKAEEIRLITKPLETIAQKYECEYLFICEKNPNINFKGIKSRFIKYDHIVNNKQLTQGHIFLAPRNLKNPYNNGHSFTKIGVAMASGLPVIASPIPSYIGSPAFLIDNFDENKWVSAIENIIIDENNYQQISKQGINYCKTEYNINKITDQYRLFLSKITQNDK